MTTKFQGVLFDLDGTLLDTLHDIGDAVNRVLAARGFPTHPVDAYKNFVGEGARLLVERALPVDQRNAAMIETCLAGYRKDYSRYWNIATRPYDGVLSLLDELVSHGLALGVLSNKPHASTLDCAQGYFPRIPFKAVLGQRDEVARKPNPSGAHEAARLMDLSATQILYVGDTGVDMDTARAAGMYSIGVTWGFRPESELRAHGANIIAHHPSNILQFLSP